MSRPQSAVKSSASQRQPPPPPAPISGAGAARMQSCPELAPPAMISLLATRPRSEVIAKTRDIASEVAARHAADVDASARFPHETFAALEAARLLSAAVPSELGGAGADMQELSASCMDARTRLRLQRDGPRDAPHPGRVHRAPRPRARRISRGYLRELVEKQLLIASVTSEVGVWGDTRSSICARRAPTDGRFKLDKDATTVSLRRSRPTSCWSPCRREPDAPPATRCSCSCTRPTSRSRRPTTWDTMGMRGTCSPGFKLTSTVTGEQIVPGSFADASRRRWCRTRTSCGPRVWLGIAADALSRAAALRPRRGAQERRASSRRKPPPGRGLGEAPDDAQRRGGDGRRVRSRSPPARTAETSC